MRIPRSPSVLCPARPARSSQVHPEGPAPSTTRTRWLTPLVCTVCAGWSALASTAPASPQLPGAIPSATPTQAPAAKVAGVRKLSSPFISGQSGYNSFRIPAIASTPKGTLLAFCEGRADTWRDKSRTHLLVRSSSDGGKTWSPITLVAQDDNHAFMDPCPVVDRKSGTITVFACKWPRFAEQPDNNRLLAFTSRDEGKTWTVRDLTAILPRGAAIAGLGPGSGIQLRTGKFAGRMIAPSRQKQANGEFQDVMLISDDGGSNWSLGQPAPLGGEGQVAEGQNGVLHLNLRSGSQRKSCLSRDGGETWTDPKAEPALPAPDKGCHAGVIGWNGKLVYTGPLGNKPTDQTDNRVNLYLAVSPDNGQTWSAPRVLASGAAGYSNAIVLPDGSLGVVYEAADSNGFTRAAQRGEGWMRIDFLKIPATPAGKNQPAGR